MGKRQKDGMKGPKTGRQRSGAAKGVRCQVGGVIYSTRRAAELASRSGSAKRCGRCRQWHPA